MAKSCSRKYLSLWTASTYGEAQGGFHGLGGAKRVAERRWSFPAGIQQNHFITSFAEIEGSMVGLISRSELAKLGYTWHAMEDACSSSKLGVEWLPFSKTGGSLLLDIVEGNASHGVNCEGNSSQAAPSEDAYALANMFECLRKIRLSGYGIGEIEVALEEGMKEKAEEFKQAGSKIYSEV